MLLTTSPVPTSISGYIIICVLLLLHILCALNPTHINSLCGFNVWLYFYPRVTKENNNLQQGIKSSEGKKKIILPNNNSIYYIHNPKGMPSVPLLLSPPLPSCTIESIINAFKLYGNSIGAQKVMAFTYNPPSKLSTTSPSSHDLAISISSEVLQLIGSYELSTSQPLSMEFCNRVKLRILAALGENQLGDNYDNLIVYFKDNENQRIIGHFLNEYLLIYI